MVKYKNIGFFSHWQHKNQQKITLLVREWLKRAPRAVHRNVPSVSVESLLSKEMCIVTCCWQKHILENYTVNFSEYAVRKHRCRSIMHIIYAEISIVVGKCLFKYTFKRICFALFPAAFFCVHSVSVQNRQFSIRKANKTSYQYWMSRHQMSLPVHLCSQ